MRVGEGRYDDVRVGEGRYDDVREGWVGEGMMM